MTLLLAFGADAVVPSASAGSSNCSAERLAELLAPATDRDRRFALDCSATLAPEDVVEKEIVLRGAAARGVVLDCRGGRIGAPERGSRTRESHRLVIESGRDGHGGWEAPSDVTVRDCRIAGTVRIAGMDGESARESSRRVGHTARAQAAAPTHIHLDRNRFVGPAGLFKLLVNVGVTDVSVTNSVFEGSTIGTTIYLGDESARIHIEANRFDGIAQRREQIALDGTADAIIRGNFFGDTAAGAVFIYRNCGERGRVRVQEPRRNAIEANVFVAGGRAATARPVIWIGSRDRRRSERPEQCALDDGLGFGSSLSAGEAMIERDMARDNRVVGNRFVGIDPARRIRDDDLDNLVGDNTSVSTIPAEWRR